MDVFSKDGTIVSDVINRVLNCREIKDLYVLGEIGEELACLYPAIHLIKGKEPKDMSGDIVYMHVTNRDEFVQMVSWILEEPVSE